MTLRDLLAGLAGALVGLLTGATVGTIFALGLAVMIVGFIVLLIVWEGWRH